MRCAVFVTLCALPLAPLARAAAAADKTEAPEIKLEMLTKTVLQYEKAEFKISVPGDYTNPFDPAVVQMDLEVTMPNGRSLHVPAFYYQHFEQRFLGQGRNAREWLYPTGSGEWRARFAPPQPGRYRCRAVVRDTAGQWRSNAISFTCQPSASKGFIQVAPGKHRYLCFSDGTIFFPLGHNLAFLHYGQYLRTTRAIQSAFQRLAAGGGNFTRVWFGAGDWALALEWPKSAWDRTWERRNPVEPLPQPYKGRGVKLSGPTGSNLVCRPCAQIGLKPATRYRLTGTIVAHKGCKLAIRLGNLTLRPIDVTAGQTRFERQFKTGPNEWWLGRLVFNLMDSGTIWITELSLTEYPKGPELLWEADPSRPELGVYNLRDAFIMDKVVEAAESTGVYLQICLLSNPVRDLYMKRLKDPQSPKYDEAIKYAKQAFRYAIASWGYSTNVAVWEFFNEMNPRLPTHRFYKEVGGYIKRLDYAGRPITTSAWHPNPADWQHPALDIANEHFYVREKLRKLPWQDEVASLLARADHVLELTPKDKPAMIAEFGLATRNWRSSPYMKQDRELRHFHNALWASALSGLAGTAMFWWWDTLDRMDAYPHYKPLADYLKDVPFGSAQLRRAELEVNSTKVTAVGLQTDYSAHIWLFNKDASWWNTLVEKNIIEPISGLKLNVNNLSDGKYVIRWWDTWRGKVRKEQRATARDGKLELIVPEFDSDIACHVELESQ